MGAASSSAGGAGRSNSTSVIVGGFDPRRRTELLAEARRKRVAWVEEARGVEEGVHGARRRRENEVAEIGRKAESELERVSDCVCVYFVDGCICVPISAPLCIIVFLPFDFWKEEKTLAQGIFPPQESPTTA